MTFITLPDLTVVLQLFFVLTVLFCLCRYVQRVLISTVKYIMWKKVDGNMFVVSENCIMNLYLLCVRFYVCV